ncbi:enoyl-CoA hydratase/isomerase family protein [Thermoplasma acidophilum]|uniref:enoyl-CoA hydratase/isomerase family protein n=1 Tax=Thermoplasma acidophilum TaxID=2303 RepID=UPI00064EAE83|nr:enoyl-CoA hydratase/isomerase family protein [Thermoplasma acidophilum]MCY0851967.1 enoyl-CoA hydratase/isomerase family protein [Thermoplasma acidophilum]
MPVLKNMVGSAIYVYLDRPDKKNALDIESIKGLEKALDEACSDEKIRAVAISGKGKDFSAGADIDMLSSFDSSSAYEFRMAMNRLSRKMRDLPKPVIAILKGYSLGGGLELAESADIRIALKDAIIGQPEVSIGINAGAGGNVILPRIVGSGIAMYMAMSGRRMNASEAKAIGLVDEVVDDEDQARKIVEDISSKPAVTLQYIKKLVNASLDLPVDRAMEEEALYFSMLFTRKEVTDLLNRWRKR